VTRFGRVGLIVHPAAGCGEDAIRELLPALFVTIKAEATFITAGTLEAEIAEGMGVRFTPLDIPFSHDFSSVTNASEAMISRGVDTIIGVVETGPCALSPIRSSPAEGERGSSGLAPVRPT